MKIFMYLSGWLILLCSVASGQCTNGSLKIKSDRCEAPKNLIVDVIDCSEIKVAWSGGHNQTYVVKATLSDSVLKTSEIKTWQITTDKTGNGEATIKVKKGLHIAWSVQAVCSGDNYNIYSTEVAGAEKNVPICLTYEEKNGPKMLIVYPNPAKDFLMVEYSATSEGNVELTIFDMNGKKVISKLLMVNKIKTSYKLDIKALSPGTYLLKSSNENNGTSHAKFVKIRM